jgi:hypothetical protein
LPNGEKMHNQVTLSAVSLSLFLMLVHLIGNLDIPGLNTPCALINVLINCFSWMFIVIYAYHCLSFSLVLHCLKCLFYLSICPEIIFHAFLSRHFSGKKQDTLAVKYFKKCLIKLFAFNMILKCQCITSLNQ